MESICGVGVGPGDGVAGDEVGMGVVNVADLMRRLGSVDGAVVLQLPDFSAVGGEAGGEREEHVIGAILVVAAGVVEDEIKSGIGGDGGDVEKHAEGVGAIG